MGAPETIVEAVDQLGTDVRAVANAIMPDRVVPKADAAGVHVESLTEAVMGMTAGLCQIADAINRLAEAVESKEGSR